MKLAVITGGSRGLGAELVRLYLEAGWQVVDISRSGAGRVTADLHPRMQAALQHVRADLAAPHTDWHELDRKLAELAAMPWQHVVFLSNAGAINPIGPLVRLVDAEIAANLNLNLVGAIRLIAAFVRHFAEHECPKTLVGISSGAAHRGVAGWSLYCAAKAGMENFIRALALEQADLSAPFTCVTFGPGVVDTDMQGDIRAASPDGFPDSQRFHNLKAQNMLRSAQNVAQVLFALCISRPENGRAYNVAEFD